MYRVTLYLRDGRVKSRLIVSDESHGQLRERMRRQFARARTIHIIRVDVQISDAVRIVNKQLEQFNHA